MDTNAPAVELGLYERDELAWSLTQARALRERQADALDWDNLAEEIEDLGKSLVRELRSRLGVLVAHVIKLHVQPERYSTSWRGTILEQQRQIRMLLDDAPSLRSRLPDLFETVVSDGYEIAAADMNMTDRDVRGTPAASRAASFRSLDDFLRFEAPLVPDEENRPAFARNFERSQG
jgi:hypothetical protein